MGHAAIAPGQQVVRPQRKNTAAAIVRWTLIAAGSFAIFLGVLVWAGVHEAAGLHGLAGYVAIGSLWATAVIASRAGASRATVWFAVGWGFVTLAISFLQHAMPGSLIVIPHAIAGLVAVVWGQHVLARTHHDADASTSQPIQQAAAEFLAYKRIAVTGVSRKPTPHGSNIVFQRLRERGYEVFAVNPNADEVAGARSYHDLTSIPGGVDAVVIGTSPSHAMATMRECGDLGITHVWMHRSVGTGSVSEEAAAWGRQRGMHVIAGGCPLMFDPAADTGHKVMRPLLTLTGKVPRRV